MTSKNRSSMVKDTKAKCYEIVFGIFCYVRFVTTQSLE